MATETARIAKMGTANDENPGWAEGMRAGQQPLKSVRSAITGWHRVRRHAVIAPVARARKCRHRHEFNRADAKLLEIRQLFDRGVECSLPRESPVMQLIDDIALERQTMPCFIGPGKAGWINDLRGPVDPFREQARDGIGHWLVVVDDIKVFVARICRRMLDKIAIGFAMHWEIAVLAEQPEIYSWSRGRPYAKLAAVRDECGAQAFLSHEPVAFA